MAGTPAMPAHHILSFATHPEAGGVDRALFRLARQWAAASRRVTLVVGAAPPGFVPPPGVILKLLNDPRRRTLWAALPELARQARPDILFCPGNAYTSLALWTRMHLGRTCPPIVAKMSNAVHRHDHGPLAARAHAAWLAQHHRFLDHLVAMTPATAAEAATATGMGGNVSVIANPPPVRSRSAPIPLPPGPVILGVGRLVAQKRWDRLIAALPRLADPAASLVILGEGPLRQDLERQAHALGVASHVHLPGSVADPLDAMARTTVLALPSDYEGVPGVLREALSVGTPVVATLSSPAIREIVTDASLGDIVPLAEDGALIAALDRRLTPGALRPAPVPMPGADSAARYLALFDTLAR